MLRTRCIIISSLLQFSAKLIKKILYHCIDKLNVNPKTNIIMAEENNAFNDKVEEIKEDVKEVIQEVNMEKVEYLGNEGCPQRDSTECEGYAGAQSIDERETERTDGADLLEQILSRDNLNRAYKRVKANKGAPGIDGMTIEDALPWLRENREKLLELIRSGKYKPQPVRRKEIPKPDGGTRKLGIPTVVDRVIQQAIAQILTPIYEPLFSDGSYGYRPNRSAQMAILKVKEYAERLN